MEQEAGERALERQAKTKRPWSSLSYYPAGQPWGTTSSLGASVFLVWKVN